MRAASSMKVASLVGVLLYVTIIGVDVHATTTIPPENVAQYVGDDVQLVCEFQESSYNMLWSECITNAPVCSTLYLDGTVAGGASPPPSYSIVDRTGSSGKRYDLVITGVSTTDGGQFKCDSVIAPAPAYAEVIVLGLDKKCSNNLTSGSEVELGDFIYLSSDVTFHGRWAPVARLRYPDNTVLPGRVNQTSGNTAKYGVVLEAVKSLQGQTLSAEWYFNDVTGTAAGEATNTPTFPGPKTCSFQAITVYYPPEGLAIDPIQESYHVGETITCTAQGNPAPGIQWINMNDSSVSVDCPAGGSCQLVVSEDLLGTVTYRCQPCNNYLSQERCTFQDITFNTYITTTSSTTVPTTTTTTEVTSTSDPRNVVLVILYWRKHGEGKNKGADSASVEREETSPSYQNIATYVNVSGGERGDGGAAPATQPGSEPYAELGPIRDPPRRAEYDVLRIPAARDLDHDVTPNNING